MNMNEDMVKYFMSLCENPLFRQGFMDFFTRMQKEGLDGARKFWELSASKSGLSDKAPDIFEQMIAFYSSLGFVPKKQYDDVVKENETLKAENEFLKNTIQELRLRMMAEGGEKARDAWQSIMDKQMEMNKEMAKNFLNFFKQKGDAGQ